MKIKYRLAIVVGLMITAGYGYATDCGTIRGTVCDQESGAVLPGATVLLLNANRGTTTNSNGYFSFEKLLAADYRVQIRLLGYRQQTLAPIAVTADSTCQLRIELIPEPLRYDEIVVTAVRENKMLSDSPQPTEIVASRDWQSYSYQNLGEALTTSLGTYVKEYGDFTAPKTISLRGSSEGQVLLLLDGQRLNLPQGGGIDLSTLPLAGLERVEISRGGSSALYGADAVGGVVNLISRPASFRQPVTLKLSSMFGSFGLRSANLFMAAQKNRHNIWLTGNQTDSDGDYPYLDAAGELTNRQNNHYRSNSLSSRVTYQLGNSGQVALLGQYFHKDQGDPGQIGSESLLAEKDETRQFFSLSYSQSLRLNLQLTGSLYHNRYDQKYQDPAGWQPVDSHHLNQVTGVQTQFNLQIAPDFSLLTGYEYRHEQLQSSDVASHRQQTHGFYLQPQIGFSRLRSNHSQKLAIVPAVRIDTYSDFGTEINPRVGVIFTTFHESKFTLRGNLGRSFRMPSFFDLYWPSSDWTVGNPHLRPEIGVNYDAGLLWQLPLNGLRLQQRPQLLVIELTYFVIRLHDLILWAPNADDKWSPQNIDRALVRGVEAASQWHFLPGFAELQIDYTYLQATNDGKSSPYFRKQLIYRPAHQLDLGLRLTAAWVEIQTNYGLIGERFINEENTRALAGYRKLDLSVGGKTHFNGLRMISRVVVQNLLDRHVQNMEGYPLPGRSFRLNLEVEI